MTHRCSHGFTTAKARQDWIKYKGISEKNASGSLEADPDQSKPLYFWQLHSLMGWQKIQNIVQNFYERVYGDDEAAWFKEAFTRISGIHHHVATQTAFWVDAFGGGRQYHGGEFRLNFHHTHNAQSVMNAAGATRWMYHMRLTLNEDIDWSSEDPRIKPCIVDFLKWRMQHYAKDHSWKFNDKEFDLGPSYNQIVPNTNVKIRGLIKAEHHNDRLGTVGEKFYSETSRYDVILDSDEHNDSSDTEPVLLSCKTDNLLQLIKGVELLGIANYDTTTETSDLNGQKGTIAGHDESTNEYLINLDSAPTTSQQPVRVLPSNVILPIGTRAKVVGLTDKKASKHNNTWGQVNGFDRKNQRYLMQIDADGSQLKIKLKNVIL